MTLWVCFVSSQWSHNSLLHYCVFLAVKINIRQHNSAGSGSQGSPVTCHVTRSQPAYRVGRPGTAARPQRQGTIFFQKGISHLWVEKHFSMQQYSSAKAVNTSRKWMAPYKPFFDFCSCLVVCVLWFCLPLADNPFSLQSDATLSNKPPQKNARP